LDVDLGQVEGSGPGDRISAADVRQAAESHEAQEADTPGKPEKAARRLPDFTKWGEVERQPMNAVQRQTASHLTHAWQVAPHVTQFDAADITQLEELRRQHAAEVEEEGGKLTLTVFLVKAVAGALKAFPHFNASLDIDREELVLKRYCHVAVAVETDRGLLVPVVRDVDRKNIFQLAKEMRRLIRLTRRGKLSPGEMHGGNFTISNSGALGGRGFTPVLHWPDVAILGVSQARMEPVWVDDEFKPRLTLPLALSYDHRVINGADGVRFLRLVARVLEDPMQMLLRG
jgi:pyruvate dehydrogenase E2 component (dihydrolipoamide acetyltransferase)